MDYKYKLAQFSFQYEKLKRTGHCTKVSFPIDQGRKEGAKAPARGRTKSKNPEKQIRSIDTLKKEEDDKKSKGVSY